VFSLFNFIKRRGVTEGDAEDSKLTGLLNIMCFISAIATFIISGLSYWMEFDPIYTKISFVIACMYTVMLFLHHFNRIYEAKIYFSTVIPIWFTLGTILIGGQFSQSAASVATIIITYVLFEESFKLRNLLIGVHIVLFIGVMLYMNFCDPILGVKEVPFDEIVIYIMAICWISIVFYIHDQKSLNLIKALKGKNQEMEVQNEQLERFTYLASHDIKSPLRNISTFLGLMKRDVEIGETGNLNEYLKVALTASNQVSNLVDGVLEVSRLSSVEEDYQMVNLNDVLKSALKNLKSDIEEKQAQISSNELPQFYCNQYDLIVVFQNIIQNGIKYNESELPKVDLYYEPNGIGFTLSFTDNGIGINEAYHDQVFEFFKRLHNTDQYSGTGLGLGVVKKILDKYGIKIQIESELNVFTRFILQFPKAIQAAR